MRNVSENSDLSKMKILVFDSFPLLNRPRQLKQKTLILAIHGVEVGAQIMLQQRPGRAGIP
jgi:hypothetical protein